MESSSQVSGDTEEECDRSESGWTKYFTPTMHKDGVDRDSDEDDDYNGGHDKDEEDSDDSMTSDARSGTSPRENLYNDINIRAGVVHSKNHDDEMDDEDIGYSKKKSYQPKDQGSHEGGRKKKEKKDPPGEGNSSLLCRTSKRKKFVAGPRT